MTKGAYHKYFGCLFGDQDRNWASHICCQTCAADLGKMANAFSMSFAVPMIWREPTNVCYFCMTKVSDFSGKSKHNIEYPSILSAIKPILHGEGLPVPAPPAKWKEGLEIHDYKAELDNVSEKHNYYFPESEGNAPHLSEQCE